MQQPTVPFCLHVELRDVNDLRSGHLSVITAVKSITLCIKFKMQGSPQFTASKLQLFSIAQASNPNHSSSPPNLVTKRKGEHSGLHLHATTSHDLTAHFFHKYCQCLQCGNYYVWIHWSKSWWGVLISVVSSSQYFCQCISIQVSSLFLFLPLCLYVCAVPSVFPYPVKQEYPHHCNDKDAMSRVRKLDTRVWTWRREPHESTSL